MSSETPSFLSRRRLGSILLAITVVSAIVAAAIHLSRDQEVQATGDEDINKALGDLKSSEAITRTSALDVLAKTAVNEDRRKDVLKAVEPCLADSSVFVRRSAARALGNWGNADTATA